jgi:hypothetical protein
MAMGGGTHCDPPGGAAPSKWAARLRARSFAFGAYRTHSAFLSKGLLGQREPTLRHVEQ